MSPPMTGSLPAVSTAQLRPALEQTLGNHFGVARSIVGLKRRPSEFCSSFSMEELDVQMDDGTLLKLMLKDLSWRGLLAEARRGKPAFLYNPLREIETYRSILSVHPLGSAIFYGAVVDDQSRRYWLFLEKVPGRELYQVGELDIWQQVACWLAAMHTRFAQEDQALAQRQAAHLILYDGDFYRLWLRRAQGFWCQAESPRPIDTRRSIDWLAERYDQVVERLVALPHTFIHGEFYASNVLVQETLGGLRVCPVDWEMAAVGPGLMDLAALTAGQWTGEEKAALALAYYRALPPDNQERSTPREFLTDLDCCRLHQAVQWLGWSAKWTPPLAQTQDWLAEALYLAEKLEL